MAHTHSVLDRPAFAAGRIDLHAEDQVTYWTEALGVSEEELRRTIADVGDDLDAVTERHPL